MTYFYPHFKWSQNTPGTRVGPGLYSFELYKNMRLPEYPRKGLKAMSVEERKKEREKSESQC